MSIINHLGGKIGTYPLLSVYTSVVCDKGEVLLSTKSDAMGLGGTGVIESIDGCLLFFEAELHREIARREMSGKVQTVRSDGTIH